MGKPRIAGTREIVVGAHGTRKVFEKFEAPSAEGSFGPGMYFFVVRDLTNKDPGVQKAARHAAVRARGLKKNARVLIAELDVENPLDVRSPSGGELWDSSFPLRSKAAQRGHEQHRKAIVKFLSGHGYDSVWNSGRNEVVAYDPRQVRIIHRLPVVIERKKRSVRAPRRNQSRRGLVRNPDERMRDLERRAALGDQEAAARLRVMHMRVASGLGSLGSAGSVDFPLVSASELETQLERYYRWLRPEIPHWRPALYADYPPPRALTWVPGDDVHGTPSLYVPGEIPLSVLLRPGEIALPPGLEIREYRSGPARPGGFDLPSGYSLFPQPGVDPLFLQAAIDARDEWAIPMALRDGWTGYLRRLRETGILPPESPPVSKNTPPRREPPPRTYEPGEHLPSGALSATEVARTQRCALCGQPFLLDAARGIKGGVIVVNVGPGQHEYYHGYPHQRRTCYWKALGRYEQ